MGGDTLFTLQPDHLMSSGVCLCGASAHRRSRGVREAYLGGVSPPVPVQDLGFWMHKARLFLPNSLQDLDGLKETHSFHQCPLIGLRPELAWTVPALTQRLIADGVMSVWAGPLCLRCRCAVGGGRSKPELSQ